MRRSGIYGERELKRVLDAPRPALPALCRACCRGKPADNQDRRKYKASEDQRFNAA
jgi:hypothetical protein